MPARTWLLLLAVVAVTAFVAMSAWSSVSFVGIVLAVLALLVGVELVQASLRKLVRRETVRAVMSVLPDSTTAGAGDRQGRRVRAIVVAQLSSIGVDVDAHDLAELADRPRESGRADVDADAAPIVWRRLGTCVAAAIGVWAGLFALLVLANAPALAGGVVLLSFPTEWMSWIVGWSIVAAVLVGRTVYRRAKGRIARSRPPSLRLSALRIHRRNTPADGVSAAEPPILTDKER